MEHFQIRKTLFLGVVFLLLASVAVQASGSAQQAYAPTDVLFTVSPDGFVHVEYTLAIESTFPRVQVPLFGDSYENLLVISSQGSALDFSLAQNILTIDSLGATNAIVTYDTPDLTAKSGALWTLAMISPVDTTVRIPEGARIVSLNKVPIEITNGDGYFNVKMPLGEQEIAYVFTFAEAKARALETLNQARTDIELAEREGRISSLDQAKAILGQAQGSFNSADYQEAEKLALQASALAKNTLAPSTEKVSSEESQQPLLALLSFDTLILVLVPVVAVIGLLLAWKGRGRGKTPSDNSEVVAIDTKKIFDENPGLRYDDREVIEFIAQRGGKAVESEIRDHFRLPKTTVWRMVNRLKDESIAEIQRLGNQNLVKLSDRYRKTMIGIP